MSPSESRETVEARVRRAPRWGVFLGIGVVLGVIAAAILTAVGSYEESEALGVVYPPGQVFGFALLWTVIALAITIRTAREHLLFSLTWWSFTFPVGTCVTGLNGLALHSGLTVVAVLAVVYYVGLVAAWITVAVRTFHGSVIRGTLLAPPQPA